MPDRARTPNQTTAHSFSGTQIGDQEPVTPLPAWYFESAVHEMTGSELRVFHALIARRQPDGHSIATTRDLCAATGLGKVAVLKAIALLLGPKTRRVLAVYAKTVYTVFPDEVFPDQSTLPYVPPSPRPVVPLATERTVQLAIANKLRSSVVFAAPNYTPRAWWECDLWAVTKAGYAVEYEIKLTLSDFKNDGKKECERWVPDKRGRFTSLPKTTKHRALSERDPFGPSRFFYVVPRELREAIEPLVPEWAGFGLFEIGKGNWRHVRFVKDAPKLHKIKASLREIRLAKVRLCFRYWQAIGAMERARVDGLEVGDE